MLSEPWIDRIFSRLAVRYGFDWARKYQGIDPAAVRADWAYALAGLAEWPEAIAHALANLPVEKPPTVGQFLELTRNAPPPKRPALPAPESDPVRVAELVREVNTKRLGIGGNMGLGWAQRMREREAAGETLTAFQRDAWRNALGVRQGAACT